MFKIIFFWKVFLVGYFDNIIYFVLVKDGKVVVIWEIGVGDIEKVDEIIDMKEFDFNWVSFVSF